IALLAVDQHVHGKNQGWQWFSSFIVHEPYTNGDCAARLKCAENFLEQPTAALFSFRVKNMAESGNVVIGAEIGFENIAFDIGEAIGYAELLRDTLRCRNHFRPVLRRHLNPW